MLWALPYIFWFVVGAVSGFLWTPTADAKSIAAVFGIVGGLLALCSSLIESVRTRLSEFEKLPTSNDRSAMVLADRIRARKRRLLVKRITTVLLSILALITGGAIAVVEPAVQFYLRVFASGAVCAVVWGIIALQVEAHSLDVHLADWREYLRRSNRLSASSPK